MSQQTIQEVISGNLAKVGELRTAGQDNTPVVNIVVASTTQRKDASGNWVDNVTVWTDVSIWGYAATAFMKNKLANGTPLLITGTRYATNRAEYTNREGVVVPAHVEQAVRADTVAVVATSWLSITGTAKGSSINGQAAAGSEAKVATTTPNLSVTDVFADTPTAETPAAGDYFANL